MATANKTKGQKEELITALYCRLSVDDDNKDMESNSITNQKQILQDFARREGYRNTQFFVDDGVSGTTFQREGFQQMQKMVEDGLIGTIIVKDFIWNGSMLRQCGRSESVRKDGILLSQRSIPIHRPRRFVFLGSDQTDDPRDQSISA